MRFQHASLKDSYHMTISAASDIYWLADHTWLALDEMPARMQAFALYHVLGHVGVFNPVVSGSINKQPAGQMLESTRYAFFEPLSSFWVQYITF